MSRWGTNELLNFDHIKNAKLPQFHLNYQELLVSISKVSAELLRSI